MDRRRLMALGLVGVVLVAVAAIALVGRGGAATGAPGDVADIGGDTGEPVVIELLREPRTLPAFSLVDLDGRTHQSADWRGKVVVLNFWATWCAPCRAEIPDLAALQDKYRDQVLVIGVSEDEGPADIVRQFASQYHVNYPIVMKTPELDTLFPGIVALPTTFVLDTEGAVVQKHVGLLRARATEATARHLAGLQVNAEVKRVDDPSKLNAEDAAQLKTIPGIDLAAVPPDRKPAVLQALNNESCTCGCGLTVAKCRLDDPQCPVSLPLAQKIVERIVNQ
jgi:thiol-disulfide isomerase/thioredoxin